MATTISSLMTTDLASLDAADSALEAACCMRDRDIGDVLVTENGQLTGIVTDRDLAVRCMAEGRSDMRLGDLCSGQLITASPDDSIDDVIKLMSDNAVRRIPVVKEGNPVGIVALGDLAMARDPKSVLGDISGAPANR